MTTTAQLIERCRNDYLHVGAGGARNKLNGAIVAADEDIVLARDLNTLKAGSKISIELEDIHVWSDEPATKTVTTDRGEYGTTAVDHADGTVVYINPKYTDSQILRAMNSTVSRLIAEGIYQVTSTNLTYVSGVTGYDLTGASNVLAVMDVWVKSTDTASKEWADHDRIRVQYDADTSVFASGTAIHFDIAPGGTTVRVKYKSELSATLAALDDVVETTVGLESDAVDLLALGAAIDLTAGKEVERNQLSAANSRRGEEVPAGAWLGAQSNLRRLFGDRVKAEKRRLAAKHPERLDIGAPSGLIAMHR